MRPTRSSKGEQQGGEALQWGTPPHLIEASQRLRYLNLLRCLEPLLARVHQELAHPHALHPLLTPLPRPLFTILLCARFPPPLAHARLPPVHILPVERSDSFGEYERVHLRPEGTGGEYGRLGGGEGEAGTSPDGPLGAGREDGRIELPQPEPAVVYAGCGVGGGRGVRVG